MKVEVDMKKKQKFSFEKLLFEKSKNEFNILQK